MGSAYELPREDDAKFEAGVDALEEQCELGGIVARQVGFTDMCW